MNKDISLLILAAGMGSRFGGLKQIEPMGPNGEFLIDYSIYDAIQAGFNKVVFLIKEENKSLVYITDTGYINRKILNKIVNVNCYIIESNHDEIMLMDGPYPRFLKERVISDKGHLSNKTTAKYLSKIVGPNTKNIILAHRSETNNTEEKIRTAIEEVNLREDINVIIAKQNEPSPLIEI